jgi:hypothetical protein
MKPKSEASTSDPYAPTKPNYVIEPWDKPAPSRRQKNIRRGISIGCSVLFAILICMVFFSSVYFLVPFRTNLLVLGIDRTPEGSDLGRSDTNILITIQPLSPYVGVLSIQALAKTGSMLPTILLRGSNQAAVRMLLWRQLSIILAFQSTTICGSNLMVLLASWMHSAVWT